jgi:hypothetical protein
MSLRDKAEILAQALPIHPQVSWQDHGHQIRADGIMIDNQLCRPTLPKMWCCSSWVINPVVVRWSALDLSGAEPPGQEGQFIQGM